MRMRLSFEGEFSAIDASFHLTRFSDILLNAYFALVQKLVRLVWHIMSHANESPILPFVVVRSPCEAL